MLDYDIREGAINVSKNSSGNFKHNFSMKALLFHITVIIVFINMFDFFLLF